MEERRSKNLGHREPVAGDDAACIRALKRHMSPGQDFDRKRGQCCLSALPGASAWKVESRGKPSIQCGVSRMVTATKFERIKVQRK